jgi:glyoxylase-like metal-dependent hydrolase (beta-lactamase superfamily II)
VNIKSFSVGPIATNTYIVVDGGEALAVDPGLGAADLLTGAAKQLGATIKFIVNTHGHWDHVVDNADLVGSTQAPLFIHSLDADMISTTEPNTFGLDVPWEPSYPAELLEEGSQLTIGSLTLSVLHTPGHSPGGICLLSHEHNLLITGDTLFLGTYGRVDFPNADPTRMLESLRRLASLPGDLQVYPGHGSSTTLSAERRWIATL